MPLFLRYVLIGGLFLGLCAGCSGSSREPPEESRNAPPPTGPLSGGLRNTPPPRLEPPPNP